MMTVLVTGGRFYAEPTVFGHMERSLGRVSFEGPANAALTRAREDGDRIRRESLFLITSLDRFHEKFCIDLLIHGDAPGADRWAQTWADLRGVKAQAYPADWKQHGRRAGPIRNRQMLKDGHPDWVIAFPGGPGTVDMVRAANAAGVKVWRPTPEVV